MKKLIALFMVVVLLMAVCTGCGDASGNADTPETVSGDPVEDTISVDSSGENVSPADDGDNCKS